MAYTTYYDQLPAQSSAYRSVLNTDPEYAKWQEQLAKGDTSGFTSFKIPTQGSGYDNKDKMINNALKYGFLAEGQDRIGPDGAFNNLYNSTVLVPNKYASSIANDFKPVDLNPHKKSNSLLKVLAVAAAIYTGGSALGLWGGSAGAATAANTVATSFAELYPGGSAAFAANAAAAAGASGSALASTIASSLASGASVAATAASTGATLEEVVVTASKLSGMSLPETVSSLATSGALSGDSLAQISKMPDLSGFENKVANMQYNTEPSLFDTIKNIASDPLTKTAVQAAGGIVGYLMQKGYSEDQAKLADQMMNADPYRDYIKSSVVPFMQGQQELSKNLQGQAGDVYSRLTDVLNTNPLGGDYANYQGMLSKSFSDPLSVWNKPEMTALNDIFRQQIERRDAATGRNSQYGARAVEMENNFLTNALPKYRTGLNEAAQVAGTVQNTAYNTQVGGLNNLYNNVATNATNAARSAIPGSNGTAGLTEAANLQSTSNAANATSLAPIFDAVGKIVGWK